MIFCFQKKSFLKGLYVHARKLSDMLENQGHPPEFVSKLDEFANEIMDAMDEE